MWPDAGRVDNGTVSAAGRGWLGQALWLDQVLVGWVTLLGYLLALGHSVWWILQQG